MKEFFSNIKNQEQHWLTKLLLYGIILFLVLMIVGVVEFYVHYLHSPTDGYKPWNTDDGMLMFTLFSALFAGFNVLAFIALTLAVERQNDRRKEKLAYYDGLRIKLEQQREISRAFDEMIPRYISSSFYEQMTTNEDIRRAEVRLKEDEFTILSIGGIQPESNYLFKQVVRQDLQELGKFIKAINEILEKHESSNEISAFHSAIKAFYVEEGNYVPDNLIAIKEGLQLDIQLTLFESMGTPVTDISIDTLPPKSQRYINQQRRMNQ